MKKSLNLLTKIFQTILSLFFFTGTLVYFPSPSAMIFLFTAVLLLPVKRLQNFFNGKLRVGKIVKAIGITMLFLAGVLIAPIDEIVDVSNSVEPQVTPIVATTSESTDTTSESVSPSPTVKPTTEPTVAPTPVVTAEPVTQNELPESSTFSVKFFDVGQADAALIECNGHYMLIDGGNKDDSSMMYTALKNAEITHLDIVVATHAHEDHIGGLSGALNYATAGTVLCPVTSYNTEAFAGFKRYAEQNGGKLTVPSVGDKLTLGCAEIAILGVNSGDENNSSIVLKIQYGETSFLFTGDAEREAEQIILNSGADLSATVLKVGHHGSDTSTTYPFLREIMPEFAVVSVGKENSYGHPTDSVLSRLSDADAKIFRTDLQGEIICTSDGNKVTVTVEKNANADTLVAGVMPTPTPVSTPVPASEQGTQQSISAEATYSYVLNINSQKFHYDWCGSVKKMKEHNKKFVSGTRSYVISMGYEPCQNCSP